MKRLFFNSMLFVALLCCCAAAPAFAQKPVKGAWTLTFKSAAGSFDVPFVFKSAGKGTFTVPSGNLAISYREKDDKVSIVFEGPGLAPDGSDLTFLVRATKTDTTMIGTTLIITDLPDANNPTGFITVPASVNGERNK